MRRSAGERMVTDAVALGLASLVALACLLGGCAATGAGGAGEESTPDHPPRERRIDFAAERELLVAFVIGEGVYNTELTAPLDILHHTVFHTEPGMRVLTVAPSLEPVTSFEGLRIVPDTTFDRCPPVDVLVVPSAEHHLDTDLEDEVLIGFVRRAGERASIVLSLCDGAFVLARAGLLDGLAATTFPSDVPRFREMFGERVDVHEEVSFVHDGKAVTSIGGARSFDAALYVVERVYGVRVARGVARGLCIDWSLAEIPRRIAPGATF